MSDVSSITTGGNENGDTKDSDDGNDFDDIEDAETTTVRDDEFESVTLTVSEFEPLQIKREGVDTKLVWKDIEEQTTRPQNLRNFLHFSWSRYGDSWYPETAALCLSFACTFAMVICLQQFDGRPSPKIPFGLTLNAIISILATTSKVSLMYLISNAIGQTKWVWFSKRSRNLLDAEIFDDASRGPLGSLRLLSTRTRWSLGSAGAFLTMLALAYDPFVQQIVVVQNQLDHSLSSSVTIQRSTFLAIDAGDITSIAALNAALWGGGGVRNATCPTANCFWDPFKSLEWCSKCQAKKASFSQPCSFSDVFQIAPLATDVNSWSTTCTVSSVTHSTALNGTTPIGGSFPDLEVQLSGTTTPGLVAKISNGTFNYSYLSTLSQASILLPKYQIIKVNDTFINQNVISIETLQSTAIILGSAPLMHFVSYAFDYDSTNETLVSPSVVDCSLELCAQLPDVSVTDSVTASRYAIGSQNGSWSRQLFPGATPEAAPVPMYASRYWYYCWTPGNESLFDISQGYRSSQSVILPTYNDSLAFCIAPPTESFWDWNSNLPLEGESGVTLTVNFNQSDSSSGKQFSPEQPDNNYLIRSVMTLGTNETAWNIASFLTQSALGKNSSSVWGHLGSPIAYIHVRGIWLIMPVLLPCCSLFFFVAIMWESYWASVPLWKSSVNALFYHGLDHLIGVETPLEKVSQLDAQAAMTTAKLAPVGRDDRLGLETSVVRLVS